MTGSHRPADRALQRAILAHTDPEGGSPYWLERREELLSIERVADLAALGPFPRAALETRPLVDFVPRALLERHRTELVLAETGGTTGTPVRATFTPGELQAAFGEPFLRASRARGFPCGGQWLFLGPSGPHVIARAARLFAHLHGALEPFTVDLDPRWVRAQEGLATALYQEHVLAQALDLLRREQPDVWFATPPVVRALADELPPAARERVRGIHLGGLPVSAADQLRFRRDFPRAVLLPGYGNSLLGVLPEVEPRPDGRPAYFALEGRLVVDVVLPGPDGEPDLSRPALPGERGRVVCHRLDESFFLPNLVERDEATVAEASPRVKKLGFAPRGLLEPAPVQALIATAASEGLY